jgi:hypothetical protein
VSLQDVTGYVKLIRDVTGADALVRGATGHVRTSLPKARRVQLPAAGLVTIAGRRYAVLSRDGLGQRTAHGLGFPQSLTPIAAGAGALWKIDAGGSPNPCRSSARGRGWKT